MLRALALLAAAAWPLAAGAETYKWVDEHGVVNYSNTPPAAAAPSGGMKLARVEDRVSTYESDPALLRAVAARAAAPRPDYAEMEWLQRQRFMMERELAQQAYGNGQCVYPADCSPGYYPYFGPVAFVRRHPVVRPTVFLPTASRSRGGFGFR